MVVHPYLLLIVLALVLQNIYLDCFHRNMALLYGYCSELFCPNSSENLPSTMTLIVDGGGTDGFVGLIEGLSKESMKKTWVM